MVTELFFSSCNGSYCEHSTAVKNWASCFLAGTLFLWAGKEQKFWCFHHTGSHFLRDLDKFIWGLSERSSIHAHLKVMWLTSMPVSLGSTSSPWTESVSYISSIMYCDSVATCIIKRLPQAISSTLHGHYWSHTLLSLIKYLEHEKEWNAIRKFGCAHRLWEENQSFGVM